MRSVTFRGIVRSCFIQCDWRILISIQFNDFKVRCQEACLVWNETDLVENAILRKWWSNSLYRITGQHWSIRWDLLKQSLISQLYVHLFWHSKLTSIKSFYFLYQWRIWFIWPIFAFCNGTLWRSYWFYWLLFQCLPLIKY